MKILLLEDRTERQKKFLNDFGQNFFDNYHCIQNFCGSTRFRETKLSLLDSSSSLLDEYSVFILHYSSLKNIERDQIISIAKTKGKKLIFFSGSIDQKIYRLLETPIASISANLLYSNNLKLFLDEYESGNQEIGLLVFGETYKLGQLLNLREKLKFYLNNFDQIDTTYNKLLYVEEIPINSITNQELEAIISQWDKNAITRKDLSNLYSVVSAQIDEFIAFR